MGGHCIWETLIIFYSFLQNPTKHITSTISTISVGNSHLQVPAPRAAELCVKPNLDRPQSMAQGIQPGSSRSTSPINGDQGDLMDLVRTRPTEPWYESSKNGCFKYQDLTSEGIKETHVLIHQPECNCLVTDDRLIMWLCIGNALFLPPSIGESVTNVANIPQIIRDFFQQLNPHIGNCHGQTIVEAKTSIFDW